VNGRPLIDWGWVSGHLDDIWALTVQHITLTAVAVSVGFGLSFALSLVVLRWRGSYGPITAVAGILYTIPSLALFVALVPITGLTATSAIIALVTYTILILVRNIVTGIDGVPADAREAAEGMGFTPIGRLRRIDLPLASPVIVAGLRIATVSTIGLVTVSALIGQGGLGQLINEGLRTSFPTKIIIGGGLSVLLAVAADVGFVLLLRAMTPWSRIRTTGA
jgi:osmoprotectant transport system permease protein